jgi:hypothetical protein
MCAVQHGGNQLLAFVQTGERACCYLLNSCRFRLIPFVQMLFFPVEKLTAFARVSVISFFYRNFFGWHVDCYFMINATPLNHCSERNESLLQIISSRLDGVPHQTH